MAIVVWYGISGDSDNLHTVYPAKGAGKAAINLEMLFGFRFVEVPIPQDQVKMAKINAAIYVSGQDEPTDRFDDLALLFKEQGYINGEMWAGIVYGTKPLVQGGEELLAILGQKGEAGWYRTLFTLDLAEYGFGAISAGQIEEIPIYHVYPDGWFFTGQDPADIDQQLERHERVFVLNVVLYDHIPASTTSTWGIDKKKQRATVRFSALLTNVYRIGQQFDEVGRQDR